MYKLTEFEELFQDIDFEPYVTFVYRKIQTTINRIKNWRNFFS